MEKTIPKTTEEQAKKEYRVADRQAQKEEERDPSESNLDGGIATAVEDLPCLDAGDVDSRRQSRRHNRTLSLDR